MFYLFMSYNLSYLIIGGVQAEQFLVVMNMIITITIIIVTVIIFVFIFISFIIIIVIIIIIFKDFLETLCITYYRIFYHCFSRSSNNIKSQIRLPCSCHKHTRLLSWKQKPTKSPPKSPV